MNKQRVLSLLMAAVTLLSALGLTAFADVEIVNVWQTFDAGDYISSTEEQIADGSAQKYTMTDGSCYIRDIGGEHDNVAWLQNIYHSSYDKSPALSYKDNGGKFTASADYYINLPYEGDVGYISEPMKFAIRSTGSCTFESDDNGTVTSGNWPAFAYLQSTGNHDYKLYLDTSKSGGWLVNNEDISYAGDAQFIEVQPNTWFTIVIDLDLVTGYYTLTYRDADGDTVLGTAKPKAAYNNGSGWEYLGGLKNITLKPNTFAMGYMLQANVENPVTCVYMDNVRIGYTPSYEIEVDGKPFPVGVGGVVDLQQPGKQLAWATLTYPDGHTEFTSKSVIHVEENMKITTQYINLKSLTPAQARVTTPEGLRFLTYISKGDYEILATGEYVKKIDIGTLISPLDIVDTAATFTKEGMVGKKYLDVRATVGKWYASDDDGYTFAGSVSDIQEGNWNRTFVGVGYITLTFTNGQSSTIYATTNKDALVADTVASAAVRALDDEGLTEEQVQMLEKYAAVDEVTLMKKMEKDLQGLNVMVLGDSQFTQAVTTPASAVWINALAARCQWNYTNLAIGGMTVSKPTRNDYNKESMYSWMFEQKDTRQFWWGGTNSSYFTTGSPTGNPEDVDFIIFEGGNNDFGPDVSAPLGKWGEKTPETFMGGWQLVTDQLLTEYPNATIIFYTPWEFGENDRTHYTRNIITMYEKYSADPEVGHRFALIDAGKPAVSGARMSDAQWKNIYSHDSFHLNEKGMELVGKNLLPILWKIMMSKQNETQIKDNLDGLDVLAIGDSLFDGDYLSSEQQWIGILAAQNNWNLTNLGTDGWTMQYNPAGYSDPAQVRTSIVNKFLNDPNFKFGGSYGYKYGNTAGKTNADVDLILLEGGTNDYGWGLPLGAVEDTNVDSLYGAYRTMIDGLLEQYPNAKIVMVTAWHINESISNRNRMDYVANAMKNVKKINYDDNERVFVLDAGDSDVSGVYMSDKTFRISYSKSANDLNHLNAIGMKVMASNMFYELWNLLYASDVE